MCKIGLTYVSAWINLDQRSFRSCLRLSEITWRPVPESVHLQDLLMLSPSQEELARAAEWVATQDESDAFKRMLEEVVKHVRQRRG